MPGMRSTVTATPLLRPSALQARFGVDAAARAVGGGREPPRLVDAGIAAAVAVDAAGRAVDQATKARRAGERVDQPGGAHGRQRRSRAGGARCSTASARPARRGRASAGRSRSPRSGTMPAARKRGDAGSGVEVRASTRQRSREQRRHAQADVAAADDQEGRAAQAPRANGRVHRSRQNPRFSLGDAAPRSSPPSCPSPSPSSPAGAAFSVERDEPILQRRDPPGRRPALRLPRRRLRLAASAGCSKAG